MGRTPAADDYEDGQRDEGYGENEFVEGVST